MRIFVDYFKKREAQLEPEEQSKTRYPVLDAIAVLQKRCAALLLVLGLVTGSIVLIFSSRNWVIGIAFIGASVLQFLLLWALSELIYVFLDIEQNTRSILQIEQNTRSIPQIEQNTRTIARKGLADFLLG